MADECGLRKIGQGNIKQPRQLRAAVATRARALNEPSSKDIASRILNNVTAASLGTIAEGGSPFVTLTNIAPVETPTMAMLMSDMASHSKNLQRDPRCSLLITGANETSDAMAGPRLTLVGKVQRVERGQDAAERSAFLDRHPSAEMYADFGDFGFYRFACESAYLIAGFGRVRHFEPSELST